jgi:hypothetical protein
MLESMLVQHSANDSGIQGVTANQQILQLRKCFSKLFRVLIK